MKDIAPDLARANLYRYLSLAPLPPADPRFDLLRQPEFRAVVAEAWNWVREDPMFQPAELGPGELLPSDVDSAALFPGDDEDAAYLEAFGHSISKDCPPYETEYCANHDITFRSQRLADVAGFYRAFGLDRSGNLRERVDHLSFEAEFAQILIARRLYATDSGMEDGHADVCQEAQRRFFAEHLGWWLPAFGVQLEARTGSVFYRGLARFVRAFTAAERALLGVPCFTELPVAQPDEYEPQGACFDCSLNGTGGDLTPPETVSPDGTPR